MDAMEVVAVVILILAIAVLVYYYLLNSPATMDRLRNYVPTNADAHMSQVLNNNSDYDDLAKDNSSKDNEDSVSKRIKVKLSDIDMSSLNTDAFSHKIDTFLDAKSEELIKDWSLATTDDLGELETKFAKTTENVDVLEKDFNEFKKSTEEKLNDLDKRIESLENN